MRLPKEEIARKLLHLFALTMPLGIYYLPQFTGAWYHPTVILGILFFGSIILEKLRQVNPAVQKLFYMVAGSMLRKEEKSKTTGSTWVIGAAFICSILFRENPWVSCIVLTCFILGDAVAALVGMSMGRIKIGKKSLEGSAACFLLSMILFYVLFPFLPGLLSQFENGVPVIAAVVTSLSITIFELVPLKITPKIIVNDNLAVPVIAGYVLLFMMSKFA